MFGKGWKFAIMAAVMATVIATPALSEGLNRRADLMSAQSGHADPGDVVMDIKVTEALPNIFGAPDIFGRRRPAGRVVVQYLGIQNGMAYFRRQNTAISSNETTMTRTPLLIPHSSQTIINGQIGTQTFSGTATTSGSTIVGPRPHSESQVELPPFAIGVKAGGVLRAEGLALRVLRVNSDGSLDYTVR
jgi:hypothetical protein